MTDIAAIKSRLSDPREVARLLGLRIEQKTRNGVLCRCPVHNNKSGSLWLYYKGGKLRMSCFGCGIYGDAIDLLAAIEGDYKAGLARAEQLAGGSSGRMYVPEPEAPRIDPGVYHELAERILGAGKLDGRAWVREVEGYLAGRRLLELARADGWACLPAFGELQRMADRDTLIAADLARYNQRGEFVLTWGRWRLVIPWRGPDGRITSLQRRRTWEHDADGTEPAKYVFPRGIRPAWPYGCERIGEHGQDDDKARRVPQERGVEYFQRNGETSLDRRQRIASEVAERICLPLQSNARVPNGHCYNGAGIAIVEGAVDALAMRALHPTFVALGLPGIGGWRPEWAKLVEGADLRICLDRGKPDPHGVIPEDRASARIALDCAGRGQETEHVLEWLISRHRRGRTLFCVLCGAPEPWLCRGCGRRRAPEGMDWGKLWERSAR